MWLEPLAQLILAAALMGQTPAGQATVPQPVVARQSAFAIPFRVDQTNPARQPVEVQLFVSTDRGKQWRLCGKAAPSQQQFVFHAPADGEYWFAVRTIDRNGKFRPETIVSPGLCVRVDTRTTDMKPAPANRFDVIRRPSEASDRTTNGPALQANPYVSPSSARSDDAADASSEARGSVAIAINPAIGRKIVSQERDAAGAAFGLPPGERPRMVNSRKFELQYDVDSIGPSGIGRVELWGTRDGGKTWSSFAIDGDNRSPMMVNVEEEGIYGFCIAVMNGAGLGGKPPVCGDLPDLWIGVDLTKPTARITTAEQGTDAEAGQLIIAWQAEDRMLASRPVSLAFATHPNGPWQPIASGLENTGRYAWPLDNRTPAKFYLRLEVRDEAGNVGVYDTPEPVVVDQSRPKVRVRDVRPVMETSSRDFQHW